MSVTGSPPVRFPSGMSTSAKDYVFGNYPTRTPMRLNEYFNDFNTYGAGDWTVTAVGGGTSALATTSCNGGKLLLSTGGANNDIQGNELTTKGFAFTTGSQVWYSINVSLSEVTTAAFMAGLSNTFAALGPTDGVYFSKPTAAATLNAIIRASSTSTTIALGTMVADTAYTLSFYYDGKPTPTLYFYTTIGMSTPTAFSVPYFSGGNQVIASASSETGATNALTNIPVAATLLTAGFALKATTAAVKTGTVDYMLASEEIVARF